MLKKLTILGSGSSLGVPRIDGDFGKCSPKNKKNYRTRCCAHLKFNEINILIDTSPDLRAQLLKNKIRDVNTILYTHAHADQTHGINDLRAFFETDYRWLEHFGFDPLDVPSNYRGLSR